MAKNRTIIAFVLLLILALALPAAAGDLDQLRARGELRHLGVPYANFITGTGDGLTVELLKLFAQHLGVRYRFVPTTWEAGPGELIGRKVSLQGGQAVLGPPTPVKGDVWAGGGHRAALAAGRILAFSLTPPFPIRCGWWPGPRLRLMRPIKPQRRRCPRRGRGEGGSWPRSACCASSRHLPGRQGVCAWTSEARSCSRTFQGKVSEIVPALIKGEAEAVLQDAPDAVMSLAKWPGQLKIIGPVSPHPDHGRGLFALRRPELLAEFNRFLAPEKTSRETIAVWLAQAIIQPYSTTFPRFFGQGP